MADLTDLTIAEARDALAGGKVSSRELTEAHVAAVEGARSLNAFITETPERALADADASDARRKDGAAGPLDGVPIAVKDLFCTEGVRTTAASHILDGFTPTYESTVTANLWDAGAVMLGKTNLDEFAMGSSNETSYHGNVENPWRRAGDNRPLVPGGSSGGSASAVAARACLGATGTDTGGSIRQPAAFCGTRRHEADLRPLLALGHRRLRVVARPGRPHDAHGPRFGDPAAGHGRLRPQGLDLGRPAACRDFEAAMTGDVKGLKIGIPKEYVIDGMEAEIQALWDQGVEWLEGAGAECVEVTLPHTHSALPTYYIIAPAEASSNLARATTGVPLRASRGGRFADRNVWQDPAAQASAARCAAAS